MSMNGMDDGFGMDIAPSAATAYAESSVGVVRAGRRDYAVGLQWFGVQEPSKAAAEARAQAATPGYEADFFCVKPSGAPQFGLGFKVQGHKSGMPSLAAHLAAVRGGSWIGLFEVAGGWYLVAVRDDGILSECDRFFEDADAARSEFEGFLSQSDWNESIAPSSFDIPGTFEVPIDDLLTGRPSVKLQDAGRSSMIMRLGLGLIIVGVVVVGGMLYQDRVEQARLQELAEQALREVQDRISPQEEIIIPPMPWEGRHMAVHELDACVEAVFGFPTDIPGWKVTELICENGRVAAAIDRIGTLGGGLNGTAAGGGSITWIRHMVHRKGFHPSVDAPPEGSGNRVRVQWQTEGVPTIPVDIKTEKVSVMRQFVLERMESRMVPVTFSQADSNEFWTGFNFSFQTTADPRGFSDVIGALPGAMMVSTRYDVASGVWSLEGRAYEQLPLPEQR